MRILQLFNNDALFYGKRRTDAVDIRVRKSAFDEYRLLIIQRNGNKEIKDLSGEIA